VSIISKKNLFAVRAVTMQQDTDLKAIEGCKTSFQG